MLIPTDPEESNTVISNIDRRQLCSDRRGQLDKVELVALNLSKINPRTIAIAEDFRNNVKVFNDITSIDEIKEQVTINEALVNLAGNDNIYKNNLPSGVTLETIKVIEDYNRDFEAGIILGVGTLALDLANQNELIESITTTVTIANSKTMQVDVEITNNENSQSNFEIISTLSNTEDGTQEQKEVVREYLTSLYINAMTNNLN